MVHGVDIAGPGLFYVHAENTASTTSLTLEDATVYRYSMCNGTEYHFNQCQLLRLDSNSFCASVGIVNCTEGIRM